MNHINAAKRALVVGTNQRIFTCSNGWWRQWEEWLCLYRI